MKSLLQKLVRASVVAGLSLVATLSALGQEGSPANDSPGIVRISKPSTAAVSGNRVTPASFGQCGSHGTRSDCDCQRGTGYSQGGCPSAYGGCRQCNSGCCRNPNGQAMCDYFRCKFGYFIPTGAGGAGVPFAGKYARVYPQDPYYFDQRDGQVWGAQGYGIPIAVPLAPTVGHAYNYSWGTPSSRLTPISRPAY